MSFSFMYRVQDLALLHSAFISGIEGMSPSDDIAGIQHNCIYCVST